jgi:hypothetical protein
MSWDVVGTICAIVAEGGRLLVRLDQFSRRAGASET